MGWLSNFFNRTPTQQAKSSINEQTAYERKVAFQKLQESYNSQPDLFASLFDRYYSNGQWYFPTSGGIPMIGGTGNRAQGKDTYGGFYTEQDLRFQRDGCRLLYAREPVAKAIEGHMNAFVIGKGMSYKICAKKDYAEEYGTPAAQERLSKYQQAFDDWADEQKWPEREQECYSCKVVDGEFFLWAKVYKGKVTIRRLEPEHIQNPPGATFKDGWYLGVKYNLNDVETPIAYGYKPDYVDWREIPADEIIHYKANVTRNVARGISDFYCIMDDLNSIAQLSDNMREGAAARAEIAYMWSVKNATPAAINAFADDQEDRDRQNQITGKTERSKGMRSGKAVAHGDNVEFTTMPQGDVEGSVSALAAALRQVGNRFCMPEYMVSADASNANYASTQMAGTPFVRKVEIEQNLLKRPFKQVADAVMKQLAVAMVIPTSELVKLDVEIECTSPVIEDEYQQAQQFDIERRNGVLSPQKWCQAKGRDYEEVQRDINEWNESNMQAPDLGQSAGATAFGALQQEKQQQAQEDKPAQQATPFDDGLGMQGVLKESAGWEETKHPRAQDGRFGHKSGAHGGKANVVNKSDLDAHIKASKKKELYRGVPHKDHAKQFETGKLRIGKGAYGPGIYVGYGSNGRDTANKAAGDEGHLARMALSDNAKVITWDEAETQWEKEGKKEYSIEKYNGTENAIAAWAKDQGYDAIDVEHNEFMNVLNPEALVVEGQPVKENVLDASGHMHKGKGEGGGQFTGKDRETTEKEITSRGKKITKDEAKEMVSGKTEKPGGVDPVIHFDSSQGDYDHYEVDLPLDVIADNQNGDMYDATTKPDVAASYASRNPSDAPPIIASLQRKGGKLFVIDGGHRVSAARIRGDKTIKAIVPVKAKK